MIEWLYLQLIMLLFRAIKGLSSTIKNMFEQVPRKKEECDFIAIRHAQSNFNKGFLSFKEVLNPNMGWKDCIQLPDFNRQVSYAKEYIDCSITEQGKAQCTRAREELKAEDIDIVLVSPHRRALETCQQIFGGRNVRVEVHPIFAEVFRFSCDISSHIQEKKRDFPEFDFGHMTDHSELWFIEILSQHIRNTCEIHLEDYRDASYEEKQEKLLQLIQDKVVYQSPQELRERAWKMKQVLKEYRKTYKRIALVSHFQVLGALLAKGFNQHGEVNQFYMLENAKPMYNSIDDLLKVQ